MQTLVKGIAKDTSLDLSEKSRRCNAARIVGGLDSGTTTTSTILTSEFGHWVYSLVLLNFIGSQLHMTRSKHVVERLRMPELVGKTQRVNKYFNTYGETY
jgi:hypothetical protein